MNYKTSDDAKVVTKTWELGKIQFQYPYDGVRKFPFYDGNLRLPQYHLPLRNNAWLAVNDNHHDPLITPWKERSAISWGVNMAFAGCEISQGFPNRKVWKPD